MGLVLPGGIAVGVTIWHNGPAIPGGSVTNSISSSPELAAAEWRIERLRSSRTIWVLDAARNAAGPSAASSGPYSLAINATANAGGGSRASCGLGWMVLDEVYAITIELFPIANLFCRGHRPRLDISSSNFPHFDVNPNSGEPEGEWQQPHRPQPRLRRGRPILAHPVADHSVGWVKIQF